MTPPESTESLPLFPLRAVVFPHGRIPLQVFEPRYQQLVKRCIRDDSAFGIVRIEAGSEVRSPQAPGGPRLAAIGTRVRLVDWFSLEHGMLGVVAEGQSRLRIRASREQEDGLLIAEVENMPTGDCALDDAMHDTLLSLWQDLSRHPQLQALGYPAMPASDESLLGCVLQVLPMAEEQRQSLLERFGSDCLPALAQWLAEQGIA